MFIENIEIKNFTVFNNCKINFSKGVNIFIGENGTGKTHLLKALYCFDRKFYEHDIEHERLYKKYCNDEYASATSLYIANSPSRSYPFNDANYLCAKMLIPIFYWELVLNNKITLKPYNMFIEDTINRNEKNDVYGQIDISTGKMVYPNYEQFEIFAHKEIYPLNKKFTYIPCKDILTNSRGFTALYNQRNMPFEYVYFDILNKAMLPPLNKLDENLKKITKKIEEAIGGSVIQKSDVFFIKNKNTSQEIEFTMIAEGHKKLALLWLLIKNGEIDNNTILLFDEPEANLNPKLTGVVVDIILELSRLGCQIFVATHSNFIVEDFSIKSKEEDNILYHSFYFNDDKIVSCESRDNPTLLNNNSIEEKFVEQYNSNISKSINNIGR